MFVRVRPSGHESGERCVSVSSEQVLALHSKPEPRSFTYDQVVDENATQVRAWAREKAFQVFPTSSHSLSFIPFPPFFPCGIASLRTFPFTLNLTSKMQELVFSSVGKAVIEKRRERKKEKEKKKRREADGKK